MLKNKTRNTIIAKKISKKTFLHKFLGLIAKKNPEAIIFNTRFGIHTFLLKFPIDVIILCSNGEIVALKKGLKANSIFVWNPKFKTVIELPEGSIEKSRTQKGDFVEVSL